MAKALATAQLQTVREIKKKANIKKANRKATVFVLALFISLIVVYISYLGYSYYQSSRFEYREYESGITFYSREFAVRDAIGKCLEPESILVVINIADGDTNYTSYITDMIVLYNTILVYKGKATTTQINTVDSRGNIINCVTNRGDVYTNDLLARDECIALQESESSKIVIAYPSNNLKEPAVYCDPIKNIIDIKPRTAKDSMISTYIVLKSKYPDLEEVIQTVEKVKKELGDSILSDINNLSAHDSNLAP